MVVRNRVTMKLSEQVAALADLCPLRVPMTKSRMMQIHFKWDQISKFIPSSDRLESVMSEFDQTTGGDLSVPNLRESLIKLSIWLEGWEQADVGSR